MHSLVVFGAFVAAVAGVDGAHSNDLIHFGAGALGRVAPEHEVEAVEGGDGVEYGLGVAARKARAGRWR